MATLSPTTADPLSVPRSRADAQLSNIDWTLDRVACWSLTAALVFLMGADFRGDTGEEFQVHWQIYLRLLLAAVAGGVGALLLFPKTYRDFFCVPGILLVGYAGWYLATLPFSVAKGYSIAAWVSLVGVLLFIPAAMRILGGFRLVTAVATGLVAFLLGSWFAYLFVPEIGVFNEQITRTEVFERMGGLGHPNELGMYAAFTTVLFAGLGVSRRVGWSLAILGMMLGLVTLVGCFSRTSMAVCLVGLAVTLQGQWRLRSNLAGISLGVGLASFVLLAAFGTGQLDWLIEDALRKVTKTGNTDELATATGRTEIWSYAVTQIAESPLYGYGYCSARFIMEEHSYHCHNIVLNAMMFGGIVAGLIVATMIAYLVWGILFNPRPEIDGLAAILVTGGMVEGLLGAPSPAAAIFLWVMLIFWRQLNMQIATQTTEAPERSPAYSMQ
ncbi:MAG: O-antigen ligase family protein [Pirellulaceae bacterium]